MRTCFCGNDNLIEKIKLNIVCMDDVKIDPCLNIMFCEKCNHNFNITKKSVNEDYISYYENMSKYHHGKADMKEDGLYSKQISYMNSCIDMSNVKKILNYGSGNVSYENRFGNVVVDDYDIGLGDKSHEKYNLIILSHVLEHVYELNSFFDNLKLNLTSDGLVYIEIPNSEYYHCMNYDVPLQEINIEHINFFSKYSLSKLLIMNNFTPVSIIDDSFNIKDRTPYYVIRGIFKLNSVNIGFDKYVTDGINFLEKVQRKLHDITGNFYIYGMGAFTSKIMDTFHDKIIDIVDDNPSYKGKTILGKEIINYDDFKLRVKNKDNIVITIIFSSEKVKNKLLELNNTLNIVCL